MKFAVTYINADMVRKIITTYIRPRLEYASVIWNPHEAKDIDKLERIQRAATRWVPELRELSYEDRLKKLNLPSLEARRTRGEYITLYKCMTKMIEIDIKDFTPTSEVTTRGNSMKIQKKRGDKDARKYFFPNRIVDGWNSLLEQIVSAKTINQFKKLYDQNTQTDGTM